MCQKYNTIFSNPTYLTTLEKYSITVLMRHKNIISIHIFLPSGNFILQDIFFKLDEIKLHLSLILPNLFPEIQEVSRKDGNIQYVEKSAKTVLYPPFLS